MSRLERERRLRRLSLTAVVRGMGGGCGTGVLAQVERGRTVASRPLRARLASFYGIPEAELFADLDAAFEAAQEVLAGIPS